MHNDEKKKKKKKKETEGVEEVMHVGCTTTHLDKRSVVRSLDLSRRGVDEEGEGCVGLSRYRFQRGSC